MHSYFDAMVRYCDFSGRSSRKQYWEFYLVLTLISGAALYFDLGISRARLSDGITAMPATLFVWLIHALPSYVVQVRRLHDIGRSGWWLLVPFIGSVLGLVWAFFASEDGGNQYGPPVGQAYVRNWVSAPPAARSTIPRTVRMGNGSSSAGNRSTPSEGRFI